MFFSGLVALPVSAGLVAAAPAMPTPSAASLALWVTAVLALTFRIATAD